VLTKALLRAAQLLGLSNAGLGRTLGVSEASISRLATGSRTIDPASKEGELALILVRVYRSVDALVGNSEQHRQAWMTSFNRAFNAAPKDALEHVEGLARVVRYLDGARAIV